MGKKKTKQNQINIFFACDDNYAPYLGTTLLSILKNTKSLLNVVVLDSGISDENKKRIAQIIDPFFNIEIEYIKIDLEKMFEGFPLHNEFHSLNVFSRYLIPELKPYLKKVLYMDVDIIVRDDIKNLFEIDLENYHLGAVPEYTDVLDKHIKEDLKLSDNHKYFNAGILLIDNEYFVQKNMFEKLVDMTLKIRPWLQDQDIFNIYFENNYKALPYRFNVSMYMYNHFLRHKNKQVQKAIENPSVIHYTTTKPWKNPGILWADYFWQIAKETPFYEQILYRNLSLEYNTKEFDKRFITRGEYYAYINNQDQESKLAFRSDKLKLFGIFPLISKVSFGEYTIYKIFNIIPSIKIKKTAQYKDICLTFCKLKLFRIKH